MKAAGFDVTHLYGLTETYGPAVVNEWKAAWDDLDPAALGGAEGAPGRALRRARTRSTSSIRTPCSRCRRDGETLGEVMFRGNVVMKGYLKNPKATEGSLRRRLVPFRRSRRQASGRLHPAQGPFQGHHHLRRREHLLDRGGGRALQASGRRRAPRWSPGPTTSGARRPAPSSSSGPASQRQRRGTHRLVPRAHRRAIKVPRHVIFARTAAHLDRQDPEVQAARGSAPLNGRHIAKDKDHVSRMKPPTPLRRSSLSAVAEGVATLTLNRPGQGQCALRGDDRGLAGRVAVRPPTTAVRVIVIAASRHASFRPATTFPRCATCRTRQGSRRSSRNARR